MKTDNNPLIWSANLYKPKECSINARNKKIIASMGLVLGSVVIEAEDPWI